MNKPIIYLPFTFLVILSVVYISMSIPSFSLIIHFPRFLYFAALLSIATSIIVYIAFKNEFDFDNLYKLTASSILFSFIIWVALITFINMQYTTKHCTIASYKVLGFSGRYTSGLGKMKKDKIKANQWILTILKDERKETFVLNKDISNDNLVTKSMDLEFCRGILGTEFLNIEQITR